jgi:hypothetical protein
MARKAVCFYKALVVGKFINQPQKCKVFSNRVLTYNIANNLKGKKIVVIDDVMIKGESLCKTLNMFDENGIKADVYIMARPKVGETDILANANIIETFEEMSEDDTQQLSKHITDFIEANICSYNIDQPIYSFQNFNDEKVLAFVECHNLIDISSGLQRKYGISSYVLKIPNNYFTNTVLKDKIDLCKIRFLYGRYNDTPVFMAIPFVLTGEIKYTELETAFSNLSNERLNKYIHNENKKIYYENQLKILHFFLGVQLMASFIDVCEISTHHRLDNNDNFIFANDIVNDMTLMVEKSKNPFVYTAIPANNDVPYDYDFVQTEYLSLAYDFLYSDKMKHSNYCDSNDNPIESELLILSELKKYIEQNISNKLNTLVFSNVIDILIDRGLIIPTLVHEINNKAIIRAYKFGEVYALNDKHFKLFSYALNKYLEGTNRDKLLRTEFEKLCVLFFREIVSKNFFNSKETLGEEDEYSICYSKFGPRVSTSKPKYAADETSTLALKLLNLKYIETDNVVIGKPKEKNDENKQSTTGVKQFKIQKYYKINSTNTLKIDNNIWKETANNFAKKYKIIYKNLFVANDGVMLFEEVRNMHMRTYLEFLVLLSIGSSKKEQLLSLLAELHLFNSREINYVITDMLFQYSSILDGLISGMWKYMCYVQPKHPIEKLYEKLNDKSETELLGMYISDVFLANRDIGTSEDINQLINNTGKLIFSIVYSLWFMLKKYHITYRLNNEDINLEQQYLREFFFRDFKDLRKTIEEQIMQSTKEQDVQTLVGLKSKTAELIKFYKIKIADGKRQPKKEKEGNDNTVIINIQNTNITDSRIEYNFQEFDIEKFNVIVNKIIDSAITQNLKEKDEIINKIDELRNEVKSKKPDKKKIYQIVDWIHKITAIAGASFNLYNLFAPSLGWPPIR